MAMRLFTQVVAILSKNWEHRQQGFRELQECLASATFRSKGEALDMLTPAIELLKRGLRDKVFPASYTNFPNLLSP